jgi:NADPH-dependent ferric siderophore reductase
VDFVLHGDGPASSWAAQAEVGQKIVIGGPRGSMIIPDAFDWYLLAGDETALPAIGRRLEELPAAARAVAVIEVASKEEEQLLRTNAQAEIIWVHRNGAEAGNNDLLLRRIEQLASARRRLLRLHRRRKQHLKGSARPSRRAVRHRWRMGKGRGLLATRCRRRA